MATKEEKIKQARSDRWFAMNGWRNGGPDGSARWSGDDPSKADAKMLTEMDIIWMKMMLSAGGLNSDTKTKYETIVNAEQAEFERLDAIYDNVKANATDD